MVGNTDKTLTTGEDNTARWWQQWFQGLNVKHYDTVKDLVKRNTLIISLYLFEHVTDKVKVFQKLVKLYRKNASGVVTFLHVLRCIVEKFISY